MKCLPRNDTTGLTSLIVDGLDSTLTLMDTSGAAITQYTYEPFGRTTVTGTTSSNATQFTGRENDGTGLYYYRARYYNPVFQRFLSEDPLGFNGGMSIYTPKSGIALRTQSMPVDWKAPVEVTTSFLI